MTSKNDIEETAMKVLIIGGAGMIGRKLSERLAKDGALGGREISELSLYDVVPPSAPAGAKMPVKVATGDFPAEGEAEKLVAGGAETIFHLAAIVSGEAEQEFDKGYRINMDGTRRLLEAIRHSGRSTSRSSPSSTSRASPPSPRSTRPIPRSSSSSTSRRGACSSEAPTTRAR